VRRSKPLHEAALFREFATIADYHKASPELAHWLDLWQAES
jgi:hypothetical protein